ncbi:carbohydrate kinase family protein, partial [Acidobacteria bacterium AH-259-O06]|nr:carbohydrate kinase family protein [Acidobacteria bacterium AH-259-O06]
MFIVIGSTTVDLFVSGLERMPDWGGDEFTVDNLAFCDEPLTMVPGGNGGNSAYVLAKLGAPVTLCSAIGRDKLGDIVYDWLVSAGVSTEGLMRTEREATSTTTVVMDKTLNRVSFHHPGASKTFKISDVPGELLNKPDALLISGYPLLPAWRPEGVAEALSRAHQAGAMTALDIGPAIGQPVELAELVPILPHVHHLICNQHELSVCTGTDDVQTGMERMLDAGAGCLVVKSGRQGAIIRQANATAALEVPGFTVETRFTVGAGDSFNAGFLLGVHKG